MISYHPSPVSVALPARYGQGFRAVDTNDVARVSKCITNFVWSPISWRDGKRHQDNFLRADWCVLDFDTPEMSLAEACKIFCDRIHIIGTTKSHQKEKGGVICDRYRVVLLFDVPITDVRIYRYNMHLFLSRYPADKACKDGARFFFPCTEIIQSANAGYTETVQMAVPERFDKPQPLDKYREAGGLPPWTRWVLTTGFPINEYNNHCHRVAKDMLACGWESEEIYDEIIKSKTYVGKEINGTLEREIRQTIKSAVQNFSRNQS